MSEIFSSPSRPFYASVAYLPLPKLDEEAYQDFCIKLFKENGKDIEHDTVTETIRATDGVTAYMQRISNMMFSMTKPGETCKSEMVAKSIDIILRNNEDIYASIFNLLTTRQRQLMAAIAREGKATNVQGAAFIKKHGLGSSSIVASAIKSLLEKDMLTKDNQAYQIYDMFFSLWLSRTL